MALRVIDVETTGLDPIHHDIWEIAAIAMGGPWNGERYETVEEKTWQVQLTDLQLRRAEPEALWINRFYERYDQRKAMQPWQVAGELHQFIGQNVLMGLNVMFDVGFVTELFKRHMLKPPWHYRTVSVEVMAAGFLMAKDGKVMDPPWRSDDLAIGLGVDPGLFRRHEALGDARMTKAMWEVMKHG